MGVPDKDRAEAMYAFFLKLLLGLSAFGLGLLTWYVKYWYERKVLRAEDCLGALYDLSASVGRLREHRKLHADKLAANAARTDPAVIKVGEFTDKMWDAFSAFQKKYQPIVAMAGLRDREGELRKEIEKDIPAKEGDPDHDRFYQLGDCIKKDLVGEINAKFSNWLKSQFPFPR
jgi:hypothetical protein